MKAGMLFRVLSLAAGLCLPALPLAAQEGPGSLLQPQGGLLWQREVAASGFNHAMSAEEGFVSTERSDYSIVDRITMDQGQALAAFFSGFSVTYRESVLRGRVEEAEFRIEAPASGSAIGLSPYFDLVFPWGSERFSAEYPSLGTDSPASAIVLRYSLFRLRYALSGLDAHAASTPLQTMDRNTVTVKLYSNRGSFAFDLPLAWFVELHARLKSRP